MSLPGLAGIVVAAVMHFGNKYILFYGAPSSWAKELYFFKYR